MRSRQRRRSFASPRVVTNAVIHSGTGPSVALRVDDDCLLELLSDRGGRGTVRQPEVADAEDISGRGLALVDTR